MTHKLAHASLQDGFAEVLDRAAADPVEHILALTYEFDDQQLLNLVSRRPLGEYFEPQPVDLKTISALAPVVIYDARKTRESNLVPHFMELLPVKMPAYTCHHSKAYLVVARDAIYLWLGSMNLTRTGLFSNREVFCDYRASAGETADVRLLLDFMDLLETGHAAFDSQPLAGIVRKARLRLRAWSSEPARGASRLLSSGYGASHGLAQLGALWREWMGPEAPDQVFAVSPFFDKTGEGVVLAEKLREQLGAFSRLHVVTDRARIDFLCKRHFPEPSKLVLNAIDPLIGKEELRRIEAANDGASTSGRVVMRKLHAKILVLTRGNESLVYTGSANFTCKAWNGDNRELGVAWKSSDRSLVRQICEGLGVDMRDLADELPETPLAADAEDEDYVAMAGYPDFVQSISLDRADGSGDLFLFVMKGEALDQLARYDIHWGQERLVFTGNRSNGLSAKTLFSRLLGGRNLKFCPRDIPDKAYFLPFRHSAELFAKREEHLHPTAEDWMQFQLGIGSGKSAEEADPFSDEENQPEAGRFDNDLSREQNPVIRMQRYLSLFSSLERHFMTLDQRLQARPAPERREQWNASIAHPLTTLASVLAREYEPSINDVDTLSFKLGELVLLARSFQSEPALAGDLARVIAARLPASSSDPIVSCYLAYCQPAHEVS
jgi:hypothetical protein